MANKVIVVILMLVLILTGIMGLFGSGIPLISPKTAMPIGGSMIAWFWWAIGKLVSVLLIIIPAWVTVNIIKN